MVSIEEGVGRIKDGTAKVGEAATVVGAAKTMFDDLSATLAQMNVDGQSRAMADVARRLEQVVAVLDGAATVLDEARTVADGAGRGLIPASEPPRPDRAPVAEPVGVWKAPPGKRRHDSPKKNDDFNERYERWVRKSTGGPDDEREYLVEAAGGSKAHFDAVRTEVEDGEPVEVLIDAKGRYDQFVDRKTGEFQEWWSDSKTSGLPKAMIQAENQVKAANGRRVEWWCAEPKSARAFNRELRRNRELNGRASAIYKPMPESEQ